MDDDKGLTITWTGPKRSWSEQDWINYRNAPAGMRRMLDVMSAIASFVNWMQKRGGNNTHRDERSQR